MKYISLLFSLLFACTCRAQSPDIHYSDPLQIGESLASRLVLCTNGNTLLFNFGQSVLAVDVYDTARRLVRQVSVPDPRITAAPLSSCKVRAVFPAGNQVLLFRQTGDGAGDPRSSGWPSIPGPASSWRQRPSCCLAMSRPPYARERSGLSIRSVTIPLRAPMP